MVFCGITEESFGFVLEFYLKRSDTNKLIYKTEIDSQTQTKNYGY